MAPYVRRVIAERDALALVENRSEADYGLLTVVNYEGINGARASFAWRMWHEETGLPVGGGFIADTAVVEGDALGKVNKMRDAVGRALARSVERGISLVAATDPVRVRDHVLDVSDRWKSEGRVEDLDTIVDQMFVGAPARPVSAVYEVRRRRYAEDGRVTFFDTEVVPNSWSMSIPRTLASSGESM